MEMKYKSINKILNKSKQQDSQNDYSNIQMTVKLKRMYMMRLITQLRQKQNANIANRYMDIASYIKLVVI